MASEHDPEQSTGDEQKDQTSEPESSNAGTGSAGSGWADLDDYAARLRDEHAAWAERLTAVETQLASIRPSLMSLAAQYRALAIEDDLDLLNRTVLGGTAMVQSLRLGYDLERYVALFWPTAGDPRPTMAREEADGEYRVEVYLHLGADGRGRVRIEGEKRLEAPLPVSRDRLRGVLLGAIRAPKFVAQSGTATPGEEPPSDPSHTGPTDAKEESMTTDETPIPDAVPRPGDPDDQPPPEEQVIPLGPPTDAREGEDGKRADEARPKNTTE